jgi:hypothetical protein
MKCPTCGGTRFWKHDQRVSKAGVLRVRVRCANPECGRRLTVTGGIRDRRAEIERRVAFFHSLAALTPLVGIVRARDRAIETSGINFTTGSHSLAKGTIGAGLRRYGKEADDYYSMVEQVVRVYGLGQRKQTDFPTRNPLGRNPPVKKVEPALLWLLLSRARGIAALVLELPRPAFGETAPSAFPSWIDRGARGADPLRTFFPPSRHACASEILEHLHRTMVAETPDGYWASPEASDWLRMELLPPTSQLTLAERSRTLANSQNEEEERWEPDLEELTRKPPPVPDPTMVLRLVKREIQHAQHLAAEALKENVDDGLRYWVEVTQSGGGLSVRVTRGGRTVGRAEARLEKRFRKADNAAELRRVAEDRKAKTVTLVVGGQKVIIPWRPAAGIDPDLAGRLVPPPAQL